MSENSENTSLKSYDNGYHKDNTDRFIYLYCGNITELNFDEYEKENLTKKGEEYFYSMALSPGFKFTNYGEEYIQSDEYLVKITLDSNNYKFKNIEYGEKNANKEKWTIEEVLLKVDEENNRISLSGEGRNKDFADPSLILHIFKEFGEKNAEEVLKNVLFLNDGLDRKEILHQII